MAKTAAGDFSLEYKPVKRDGFKTLRGFYKMLKKQNKLCKKANVRVNFDVTLPI